MPKKLAVAWFLMTVVLWAVVWFAAEGKQSGFVLFIGAAFLSGMVVTIVGMFLAVAHAVFTGLESWKENLRDEGRRRD